MSLHSANPDAVAHLQGRITLLTRPPTVLVIEDNLYDSEVQCGILQQLGCVPLAVRKTAEAWEAMRLTAIDFVVLDLSLPDGDGAKMIRDIGERKPGMPVIVVTGMTNGSPFMQRAVESGAQIIFTKPITLTELRELTGLKSA